jgi:hypothetical protein
MWRKLVREMEYKMFVINFLFMFFLIIFGLAIITVFGLKRF